MCNDHVKKLLYYSFFHSQIMYLLMVWSGTSNINIKKIQILQNKCIRNIFYNKYRLGNIRTKELFEEYKIITFENLIELELNVNLHKIENKKMKANIEIQYNNQFHEHDTRHSRNLRKIKTRNKWGEKSIINRCIQKYNQISPHLKNEKNITKFKNKLKKLILDKQFHKHM